jgi:hypothetical protein
MSLELWNTVAATGTFVVIAATAVAATVQLRHMRGSNQILALNEVRETLESESFREAMRFVAQKLPALVADESQHARLVEVPRPRDLEPISIVANFFEGMGAFVRYGIVDRRIACDLWGGVVLTHWRLLSPVIALNRAKFGTRVWENFEYVAVISEDFLARFPEGTYPRALRRMALDPVPREEAAPERR